MIVITFGGEHCIKKELPFYVQVMYITPMAYL